MSSVSRGLRPNTLRLRCTFFETSHRPTMCIRLTACITTKAERACVHYVQRTRSVKLSEWSVFVGIRSYSTTIYIRRLKCQNHAGWSATAYNWNMNFVQSLLYFGAFLVQIGYVKCGVQTNVVYLNTAPIQHIFSPPGSDSLRKRTYVLLQMFFFCNARSPRCVGRPAWNFAWWSVLGTIL